MSVQENEYQQIFCYLRSLNFHFSDTWVIECVNYYKMVNPGISIEVLKTEVKQQWLLVNLREIKVPSLPHDLKSKENIILNGTYAVQVESMIDSSKSCYTQFQKLLKINTEDIENTAKPTVEWNIKSNRCLTFVICDGVQELEAMEYQPIKNIHMNDPELLPGFKMVIMGPVECRKGMILLKDENVRVCGGEVDTLTDTNSLKKILIRKLNLNEADYSNNVPSDTLKSEDETYEPLSLEKVSLDNSDNLDNKYIESLLSQNNDVFFNIPLESEILAQEIQPKHSFRTTQDVYENHLFNQNINDWSESELNQNNQMLNKKKHSLPQEDRQMPNQKRHSLDLKLVNNIDAPLQEDFTIKNPFDVMDKDIFMEQFNESQSALYLNESNIKKPLQAKLPSIFKNSILGECKTFTDSDEFTYISDKPFLYLKHIMPVKLTKHSIFTIKAVVLTLKKKITIENNEFNLKATITDGSVILDVDFNSNILEEFLGFSPCEMAVMLKAKQTNSCIAQRIKESFSKAQEKLISLNCLMKLQFFMEDRSPVILSLEEVTAQHLKTLKERS